MTALATRAAATTPATLKVYNPMRHAESDAGRNAMVEANLGLVGVAMLRAGLSSRHVDAAQAGRLALVRAVEKWQADPSLADRVEFSTFATWHVFNAVRNEAHGGSLGGIVNIKRRGHEVRLAFHAARQALASKWGRAPTDAEVFAHSKMRKRDRVRVEAVLKLDRAAVGIVDYDSAAEDAGSEFQDGAGSGGFACGADPGDHEADVAARDEAAFALASLPVRSRRIVEARFGLGGQAPRSLDDLAREFGMTYQAIQHIVRRALPRMKAALEAAR